MRLRCGLSAGAPSGIFGVRLIQTWAKHNGCDNEKKTRVIVKASVGDVEPRALVNIHFDKGYQATVWPAAIRRPDGDFVLLLFNLSLSHRICALEMGSRRRHRRWLVGMQAWKHSWGCAITMRRSHYSNQNQFNNLIFCRRECAQNRLGRRRCAWDGGYVNEPNINERKNSNGEKNN